MEILADTHVHVYPVYDPAVLIRRGVRRLRRSAGTPSAACALFLAEGRGFDFFSRLRDGSAGLDSGLNVEREEEIGAVRVTESGGESIWIIAGRQIVTAERVEILALTLTGGVEDGRPSAETVEAVLAQGGVPVLAWAPGKWMFRRASVIESLLDRFGPQQLSLGDTTLRPLGWPAPAPMRDPSRRVLAGSDPLPLAGEEARVGSYGVRLAGGFDPRLPVTSFRKLLTDPDTPIQLIGRRDTPWRAAGRLFRHHRQKRGPR